MILKSKLSIPPLRPFLVPRKRLVDKLNAGSRLKLTLLSAPAGFGKTTLLCEWIAKNRLPAAWISLDKSDNDPFTFLSYLLAALRRIKPTLGRTAEYELASPRPSSTESILISLINDVSAFPRDCALVLDDYHLIEEKRVHEIVEFLIEHCPKSLHLLLSTRSDPPLALARLRSQNQLVEVRVADLNFTFEEIRRFFNETMGLHLSDEHLSLLESKTEGWITGLHLVALLIEGRKDAASLIKSIHGDNRYIGDYLMEEVLNRQSEEVQSFLLQTSILNRLSASLCDAVTQRKNSYEMLKILEKANLFIFPLDQERQLFRYHRRCADMLYQRRIHLHKQLLSELHRRASQWYDLNGIKDEALMHALAAGDFERAARLLEEIAETVWEYGKQPKLVGWIESLPESLVTANPSLSIYYARALLMSGKLKAAEQKLEAVEKELARLQEQRASRKEFTLLKGKTFSLRAMLATYRGDVPEIIFFAREALASLAQDDFRWRAVVAAMLGMAHGWAGDGDLEKAKLAFRVAESMSEAAGILFYNLFARSSLLAIEALQGRLKGLKERFRELTKWAENKGLAQTGIVGTLYSSLGHFLFETNEVEEGISHIEKGLSIAKNAHDFISFESCRLTLIRILSLRGDFTGAENLIAEIEKDADLFSLPPWMLHQLSALKARIWLNRGDLDSVLRWIKDAGLSVDDPVIHRREAEYLVLARILISQSRWNEADRLLLRLIRSAEEGTRFAFVIEVRIVRALCFYDQGDIPSALTELKKALSSAEPGGLILFFVSEGPPLVALLEKILNEKPLDVDLTEQRFSRDYVKKILWAFKTDALGQKEKVQGEILSGREVEVLRLIANGLSNQEIAAKLFISLNTVRSHTKNINSKLDVHNRSRAVVRARELGII